MTDRATRSYGEVRDINKFFLFPTRVRDGDGLKFKWLTFGDVRQVWSWGINSNYWEDDFLLKLK